MLVYISTLIFLSNTFILHNILENKINKVLTYGIYLNDMAKVMWISEHDSYM